MVLHSETHDMLKMSVVDMCIYSEESLKNDLDGGEEVLREGNADLSRE